MIKYSKSIFFFLAAIFCFACVNNHLIVDHKEVIFKLNNTSISNYYLISKTDTVVKGIQVVEVMKKKKKCLIIYNDSIFCIGQYDLGGKKTGDWRTYSKKGFLIERNMYRDNYLYNVLVYDSLGKVISRTSFNVIE